MLGAVVSVHSLTGHEVVNEEGAQLGIVEDFIIDVENGNVVYAMLVHEGHPAHEEGKLFLVPLPSLALDVEHQRFILHAHADRLEHAPGYSRDRVLEFSDEEFKQRLQSGAHQRVAHRERRFDETDARDGRVATAKG